MCCWMPLCSIIVQRLLLCCHTIRLVTLQEIVINVCVNGVHDGVGWA
jgi:hypothetical protein